MKLVQWPLMGGLLRLVQRGGDWAAPQPAQSPPRCTKCNSPSINGQCTNHRIARCCSVLRANKGLKPKQSRFITVRRSRFEPTTSWSQITHPSPHQLQVNSVRWVIYFWTGHKRRRSINGRVVCSLAVVSRFQGTSFGRRRLRRWRHSDVRAVPEISRCCLSPSTRQTLTKMPSAWYTSPLTSRLCHQWLQQLELTNNGRPQNLP